MLDYADVHIENDTNNKCLFHNTNAVYWMSGEV